MLKYIEFFTIIILLSLIYGQAKGNDEPTKHIELTHEEQDFITAHPVITVYNSQDWVPYNFFRNGIAQGYTIDYLDKIADKTGIKFEYISNLQWDQAVDRLKHGKLDIIPNISQTEDRKKFALFTKPVLKYSPAIISRKSNNFRGLNELQGLKVAIVKGYWYEEILQKYYPKITLLTVSNNLEALKLVAFKKADAVIGNAVVLENLWLDNNITNLEVCSEAVFPDIGKHYSCIGIRKDWGILKNILNKGIESITYKEELELKSKWLKNHASSSEIVLTPEEKVFLNNHRVIRTQNGKDWAPLNFHVDGRPQGYSIELIKILAKKLGIKVEYITGPSRAEFVEMLKNKQLDIICDMVQTDKHSEYAVFSTPIFTENPVIVSHIHNPLRNLAELKGKTVAVVKGHWYEEILSRNYPDIKLLPIRNIFGIIKAVASGKADACIGTGTILENLILANNLNNTVIVSGEAAIKGINDYYSRLGIREDWPILRSALNKALASLTYQEMQALKDKWLNTENNNNNHIELSIQESVFLKNHSVITVQNENEWIPFNFNNNGTPSGLSIDYMSLIAEKAGFYVDYIQGKTWDEYLNMIKDKRMDLILNAVKTPDREKYLHFTDPYITNPNIIVSRKEMPYNSVESLGGKKVALIKGFFYEKILTDSYTEIELLLLDDFDECLKAVTFKKADAAFGELAVANYFIEKNFYTNLQLSGEVILGDNLGLTEMRIGVRKDWPILLNIIQKAIKAIPHSEIVKLRNKWVTQKNDTDKNTIDLSIEEKMYLRNNGNLKLCLIAGYNPYLQKKANGKYTGIMADFIEEFSRQLSMPVTISTCTDWDAALVDINSDTINGVSVFHQPREYHDLSYTSSCMSDPIIIAARNDAYFLNSLKKLNGKKVAITENCHYAEYIRQEFPEIELIKAKTRQETLRMVSRGEAFATIGPLFVISNMIQQHNFSNIQIVGQTDLNNNLRIGVKSSNTILLSILNKLIDSIDDKKRNEILSHWYKISFTIQTDWSLVWKIIGGAVIIMMMLASNIIAKNRFNKRLEASNMILWDKNKELFQLKKKLEKQNELLVQLTVEDDLTKIYNRRKLDNTLYSELKRSQRFNHPFGLILLDIDNFKEVNDTYGHQTGDEALVSLAATLQQHIRETDILGRWGGEEFMIICPEVTDNGMMFFAEEIRIAIAENKFPMIIHRTASLGVTISTQKDNIQTIVKRVDDAMYEAKRSGKNKVIFKI